MTYSAVSNVLKCINELLRILETSKSSLKFTKTDLLFVKSRFLVDDVELSPLQQELFEALSGIQKACIIYDCKGSGAYKPWQVRLKDQDIEGYNSVLGNNVWVIQKIDMVIVRDWCLSKDDTGISGISVISGEGTGGQFLRSIVGMAGLQLQSFAQVDITDITCVKDTQATTLLVQLWLHLLKDGQTATFKGGNRLNSNAPNPQEYQIFLKMLRKFGLDFTLAVTNEGFLSLTRNPSEPVTSRVEINEKLEEHQADNMLMACVFNPGLKVSFRTTICGKEYHVKAMIKLLRLFGREVSVLQNGEEYEISI